MVSPSTARKSKSFFIPTKIKLNWKVQNLPTNVFCFTNSLISRWLSFVYPCRFGYRYITTQTVKEMRMNGVAHRVTVAQWTRRMEEFQIWDFAYQNKI
jgi:hypothetical protein